MSYRIAVFCVWSAVFASMALGCSAEPATPFAQASWQIFCTGCGVPAPHSLDGYDGEGDIGVDCRYANGDLTFSLSTRDDDNRPVRLSLLRASVGNGGSANNPGCTVEVLEGANTYVGECGFGCIVNNVELGIDETSGRPLIEGDIQCTGISPLNNQSLTVDVGDRGGRGRPLHYAITDCTGFQP